MCVIISQTSRRHLTADISLHDLCCQNLEGGVTVNFVTTVARVIFSLLSMTDWLTDWPTDWPTNRPTDRPTDRLTDRPTDWPTDRPTDCPELTSCWGVDTESGGHDSNDPEGTLSRSLNPILNQTSPNSIVKSSTVVVNSTTTFIICCDLSTCSFMYRSLHSVDDLWPNWPASYPTRYLTKFSKLWDSRTYIFMSRRYLTKFHCLSFPSHLYASPFFSYLYFPRRNSPSSFLIHIPLS